MFDDLPATRGVLARIARTERRVQGRIDIPAPWLRLVALLVNVGLWVLIIWAARMLLRR